MTIFHNSSAANSKSPQSTNFPASLPPLPAAYSTPDPSATNTA